MAKRRNSTSKARSRKQNLSAKIEEYLQKREGDSAVDPILFFAKGHMSITLSLLARWPDLKVSDRPRHVEVWYKQLLERMMPIIDKYFDGQKSSALRAAFVRDSIGTAVGHLLGNDFDSDDPDTEYYRKKLLARARNIYKVLQMKIEPSFGDLTSATKDIIVLWGQHGQHFPNFKI